VGIEVVPVVWGGLCINVECFGIVSGRVVRAPHVPGLGGVGRVCRDLMLMGCLCAY
jgi:hypothetical protein